MGEISFQTRRKLWRDSDCSVSLFAIMEKLTVNQRVGLVEGDTHSCGAVNIGAGSCRGEPAENRRPEACEHVSPMSDGSISQPWPRETQTTAAPEVRGSSPDGARVQIEQQHGHLPQKMFSSAITGLSLQKGNPLSLSLPFSQKLP